MTFMSSTARKDLKRRSQAGCKPGCKGYIVDAERGRYCDHIEAQLPKMGRSVKAVRVRDIESFPGDYEEKEYAVNSWEEMSTALHTAGMRDHEIEMIEKKFLEGATFREMTEELGMHSPHYEYKKVLKKLRKAWKKE